ncbi:hypothetical protein ACCO45_000798 [Purpureocillium lilacinum]|uniref:Uncharacterized protein n=1 Tax=Purpureocillium lilacinum TaxID=33203 RepID=A0ACC4E7T7_PURLI
MRQTKEQILQSNCPRHATCPAAKCGALQQADVCTSCTAASDEQNKPVWQPKAAASHRCLPEPVPFSCRPEPQATEFEFEFDTAAAWVMRPPSWVAWVASGLVSRSLHCRRRGAEPTRQVRLAARPERLARPWPHYPLARADQTPPRPLSIAQPRPGLVCLSVSAVQGSEAFSNSDAAPQASRSLAAPMTMRPGLRSRPQQAQTHGGPKSGVAEQKRVPFVSSRPQAVPMAHLHPEQALLQPQLDSGQY